MRGGRAGRGGRGGQRGQRTVVSDETRATVIDHVLVHGVTMKEARLRVYNQTSVDSLCPPQSEDLEKTKGSYLF